VASVGTLKVLVLRTVPGEHFGLGRERASNRESQRWRNSHHARSSGWLDPNTGLALNAAENADATEYALLEYASSVIPVIDDGVSETIVYGTEGFLGLTPRQMSSGGKERLLGISKRGDAYLRTLLIHGARSALRVAARKGDPRSRWVVSVGGRCHRNIAAVALANKNARIAWALLSRGGHYDSQHGYREQQSEAA